MLETLQYKDSIYGDVNEEFHEFFYKKLIPMASQRTDERIAAIKEEIQVLISAVITRAHVRGILKALGTVSQSACGTSKIIDSIYQQESDRRYVEPADLPFRPKTWRKGTTSKSILKEIRDNCASVAI
jgi:hypothetical protein